MNPWRGFTKRLNRLRRHSRRWLTPIHDSDILQCLERLGPLTQHSLFVHSSLSACGHVVGGPATVVTALRQWSNLRNLVMPTHTYCYPDATGQTPLFDVTSTPSLVGAITDYFWRQNGVIRSLHPTHSLAAEGPGSDALCSGHDRCDTPCGTGTPYHRLVTDDCGVLMFGANMSTYTLFHTAEDAASVPYLYESQPYTLRIKDAAGNERPFPMRRQDYRVTRRFDAMADWLESRDLLRRLKLGRAELLWLPHALAVHEVILRELRSDPLFFVARQS